MASSPAATLDPVSATPSSDPRAGAPPRPAASAAASAGRGGKATTLSLAGLRTASRRRIRVVGRPLAAGALAQNAAQPQENEYCERQEDDGVNIEHVFYSLGVA